MRIMKFNEVVSNRLSKDPKIGDYVICRLMSSSYSSCYDKVGRIENINNMKSFPYLVKYDFLIYGNTMLAVNRDEIVDFDKDKDVLELRLNANKYNL